METTSSVIRNSPEIRLAALEEVNIAKLIASEAGALRKIADRVISGIENLLIERILVNRVKKALTTRKDQNASLSMLHETREAYHDGAMETFPRFVPQTKEDASLSHLASSTLGSRAKGETNRPILLYLAGGGFIVPPSKRQKYMIQRLSEATNCEVVLIQHRLAPEHPFPAALHDVVTHYNELLNNGLNPNNIFIGADTAGASLAMGALQILQDQSVAMPAGMVLFSPWCDLSLSGWSYITSSISTKSPFRMETAAFCARLYLQNTPVTHPHASPIFASLRGFPPILIHTSEHDLHFDDAIKLAENGEEHGCDVRINYWDSPRHHLERLSTKDAARSFSEVSRFINRVWKSND